MKGIKGLLMAFVLFSLFCFTWEVGPSLVTVFLLGFQVAGVQTYDEKGIYKTI